MLLVVRWAKVITGIIKRRVAKVVFINFIFWKPKV